MNKFIPRKKPENIIVQRIRKFLERKRWLVIKTTGNIYQSGLPDLFATHKFYKARWIEVKNPGKFRFTAAQLDLFPKLCENGSGVWVLVDGTEAEYVKLFNPPNWHTYLRIMK